MTILPDVHDDPHLSFKKDNNTVKEIEIEPGKHRIILKAICSVYPDDYPLHPPSNYFSKVHNLDILLSPGQKMKIFLNVYTKPKAVVLNVSTNQ